MSEFKDLTSDAGLSVLNKHLSTRSYIDGFKPSQSDVALLAKINVTVNQAKYPHVDRWLNHITSFNPTIRATWSGSKAPVEEKKAGGKPASKAKAPADEEEEDDDDFAMDLSGDDDDEAANAIIAKKAQEKEAAKKAAKAGQDTTKMAKSTLVLDIKPEDSETNLDDLEKAIREITMEGLLWAACEKVPVAFGIKKLRMGAVVVDDLVSVDELQETIEALEGCQSTDIAAFNKI